MSQGRVNLEVALTAGPAERGSRQAETAFERAARGARNLSGASRDVDLSWRALAGTATRVAGVLGVALTGREIVRWGRDSVQASEELQTTFAGLALEVERSGISWELAEQQLAGYTDALWENQRLTGGEAAETLRELLVITGDYATSLEAVGIVADVAAGLEMERGTAARYVGRILTGQTTALRRYGVELDGTGDLLEQLSNRFDGAATAATSGREAFSRSMGDLQEVVGAVIREVASSLGTWDDWADRVQAATRWIAENSDEIVSWGRLLVDAGKRAWDVVSSVVSGLVSLGYTAAATIDATVAGIVLHFGRMFNELSHYWDDFATQASRIPGVRIDARLPELDLSEWEERLDRAQDEARKGLARVGEAGRTIVDAFATPLERSLASSTAEARELRGQLNNISAPTEEDGSQSLQQRIQLLARAVELGVATSRETIELISHERSLLQVLNDQTRSLEERTRAAEQYRRIAGATRLQLAPIRTPPLQGPSGGLVSAAPGRVSPFGSAEEARAARESLEGVSQALQEVAGAADVSRGLIRVADGLGMIDRETAQAIRGLDEFVRGIQQIRDSSSAGGGLASAAAAGGWAGVLIGAGSIVGGLLSRRRRRRDEERRQAEEELRNQERLAQASEDARRRLDGFIDSLERVGRLEGLSRDLEASVREAFLSAVEARQAGLGMDGAAARESAAEQIEFLGLERIVEEWARFIPEFEEFAARLREGRAAIERQRQEEISSLGEELAIRRAVAEGRDADVEAMREAAEIAELLARARALESDEMEAEVEALWEILQARRGERAEMEAAQRELEERLELLDLETRELRVQGRDREALVRERRRQAEEELAAARELVRQGERSPEWFRRLAAVIDGELRLALTEFDRSAREAARSAREAALAAQLQERTDEERLRIRALRAQGLDRAARAAEAELELTEAIRAGRSSAYLELLRLAQAEEARTRSTREAADATQRMTRELDATSRSLNAPTGVPEALLRLRAAGDLGTSGARDSASFAISSRSAPSSVQYTIRVDRLAIPPSITDPGAWLDRLVQEAERRSQDGGANIFELREAS